MNPKHGRLIRGILDAIAAQDIDDSPRLTDERLHAAIFGQQPLNQHERRLLALSAATRDRLAWLRHLERARALSSWQQRGIDPKPLQLLAAADTTPAIGPLRLTGEGYSVALTPVDLEGREWHIAVQIAAALIAATPGGFQLVDSEGLIWLTGHPDAGGIVSGYWNKEEQLWSRVHRVQLALLPM